MQLLHNDLRCESATMFVYLLVSKSIYYYDFFTLIFNLRQTKSIYKNKMLVTLINQERLNWFGGKFVGSLEPGDGHYYVRYTFYVILFFHFNSGCCYTARLSQFIIISTIVNGLLCNLMYDLFSCSSMREVCKILRWLNFIIIIITSSTRFIYQFHIHIPLSRVTILLFVYNSFSTVLNVFLCGISSF